MALALESLQFYCREIASTMKRREAKMGKKKSLKKLGVGLVEMLVCYCALCFEFMCVAKGAVWSWSHPTGIVARLVKPLRWLQLLQTGKYIFLPSSVILSQGFYKILLRLLWGATQYQHCWCANSYTLFTRYTHLFQTGSHSVKHISDLLWSS